MAQKTLVPYKNFEGEVFDNFEPSKLKAIRKFLPIWLNKSQTLFKNLNIDKKFNLVNAEYKRVLTNLDAVLEPNEEELRIIKSYCSMSGYLINQTLRGEVIGKTIEFKQSREYDAQVLERFISEKHPSIPFSVTVWRGMRFTKRFVVGDELDMNNNALISTSLSVDTSIAFIDEEEYENPGSQTLFEFNLPVGTNCIFLATYSDFPDEMEILLPRGSRFSVVETGIRDFRVPYYKSLSFHWVKADLYSQKLGFDAPLVFPQRLEKRKHYLKESQERAQEFDQLFKKLSAEQQIEMEKTERDRRTEKRNEEIEKRVKKKQMFERFNAIRANEDDIYDSTQN